MAIMLRDVAGKTIEKTEKMVRLISFSLMPNNTSREKWEGENWSIYLEHKRQIAGTGRGRD